MSSKIGKCELEIIDYLERGERCLGHILADFSPTITVKGKVYYQYSVVLDRLHRMEAKGLITIENKGFMMVRLIRKRKGE